MVVGENAARWLRVSTLAQDEANQEPDIDKWCREHGYVVRKTFSLKGKSASKGKQEKALSEMLEDMRRGIFTVLVVWASDRIERRGAWNAFDLARRVREAGGRIEYVRDSYLNEANDMSDVLLALAATKDKEESRRKGERTKMAYARVRAEGSFVGRKPFGYDVTGTKYARQLVPSEDGRRLVPEVYARVIEGQSLRSVAAWLEAETGRKWWTPGLGDLIKNPVYRGVQEDDQGRPIHRCEALVDAATWKAANDALANHPKRGPENKLDPAMLAGVVFCGNPACDATGLEDGALSPMYRQRRSSSDFGYYRCSGRGVARKGCGNLVPVPTLDGIVRMLLRHNPKPYTELTLIPGVDHKAELQEIVFEIKSLATLDLTDDEYDARLRELRARRDTVAALESTPDRWDDVNTGKTWGDMWKAVEPALRGPWLRENGFTVRATRQRITLVDKAGRVIFEHVSQTGHRVTG